MIHTEHLRKADESYEIRFNSKGDVMHAYFKDGEYIVFPTLQDLINYIYLGDTHTERQYCTEKQWTKICNSEEYSYYKIKFPANQIL